MLNLFSVSYIFYQKSGTKHLFTYLFNYRVVETNILGSCYNAMQRDDYIIWCSIIFIEHQHTEMSIINQHACEIPVVSFLCVDHNISYAHNLKVYHFNVYHNVYHFNVYMVIHTQTQIIALLERKFANQDPLWLHRSSISQCADTLPMTSFSCKFLFCKSMYIVVQTLLSASHSVNVYVKRAGLMRKK